MAQWLTPHRRAWLYSIAASLSAVALAYDLLNPDQAATWLALTAAALGIAAPGVALANINPTAADYTTAEEPDIEVE